MPAATLTMKPYPKSKGNAMNFAPIVRILLRYLSGVLITYGLLSPEDSQIFIDPELIGLLAGFASEAWYAWAQRKGKAT